MSSRRTQRGVSLIEVLVSVLILAIGLVGVAGLQAFALKNNQSAQTRSQASALAYDLADRMRGNVAAAIAGMYNPATAAELSACRTASGCTLGEMAQDEMQRWLNDVEDILPLGAGWVCIDSTPNDGTGAGNPECDGIGTRFTVKIWWDDDHDGEISVEAPNIERLAITFQL